MDEPHCMRCSRKLVEDRGICADCEILFLDDAVRLKQALEVALRDERQALLQLGVVQARCTELLEENRRFRKSDEQMAKIRNVRGIRLEQGELQMADERHIAVMYDEGVQFENDGGATLFTWEEIADVFI